MQLVWKPAFRCGNDHIDRQHRTLFDLANTLHAAVSSRATGEDFLEAADALVLRVAEHFRDEEEILAALGYRDLDRHIGEHVALLAGANGLLAELRDGGGDIADLLHFFAYELVARHVLDTDRGCFDHTAAFAQAARSTPGEGPTGS